MLSGHLLGLSLDVSGQLPNINYLCASGQRNVGIDKIVKVFYLRKPFMSDISATGC